MSDELSAVESRYRIRAIVPFGHVDLQTASSSRGKSSSMLAILGTLISKEMECTDWLISADVEFRTEWFLAPGSLISGAEPE